MNNSTASDQTTDPFAFSTAVWTIIGGAAALLALILALANGKDALAQLQALRQGRSEELLFDHLRDGAVHVCDPLRTPPDCHERVHDAGPNCWESSIFAVFNQVLEKDNQGQPNYPMEKTARSPILPPGMTYLHIDWDLLYAFVILATNHGFQPPPLPQILRSSGGRVNYNAGGVELEFRILRRNADSVLTVHLKGLLQSQSLTKQALQRILRGEPPLYQDPRDGPIPSIRRNVADDLRRGGWVVALGFEHGTTDDRVSSIFVPLYMDELIKHPTKRRSGLFWISIDRVHAIIENRVAPCFPASQDMVRRSIATLENMNELGTDTGVAETFPEVNILITFSDADRRNIIGLFNGSNQLSTSDPPTLYAQFGFDPSKVLIAAVRGAMYCAAYIKNEGRELDRLLANLRKVDDIWVRKCSIPLSEY